jgi:hypothetical protein
MILSGLKIYSSVYENSVRSDAVIQRYDTGTTLTTLSAIPTGASIYWTICGVNPDTLSLIDSNLQDVNFWLSKKFDMDSSTADYPIADIMTVSGTYAHFHLYPFVVSSSAHQGITPYFNGGTSIEVFVSGGKTNYNLPGRHLSISNTLETEDAYFRPYLLSTPPSGILSGLWIKDASTSGREVSGLIDYSNGHISLDFRFLPDDVFENNYRTLYVKWEGNYGDNIFPSSLTNTQTTYNPYVSNARLNFNLKDDIQSYYIAVSTFGMTELPSQGGRYAEYIYHPYKIALLENNYDFTTASLSAVYKQRNNYSQLKNTLLNLNKWPFSSLGRAIVLSSSSPLVSAYAPNAGGGLSGFSTPISGWSTYIDDLQLTSVGTTPATYTINAYFPDDTLSQRTTATYTFDYSPIVSEDLKISVLSENLSSEFLRVFRQVNTPTDVVYVTPQYPLIWTLITSSLSNSMSAISGIVGEDLTNEKYFVKNTPFTSLTGSTSISNIALSSSTGIVTGYDMVNGLDYLNMVYTNNPDLIYTFSVAYSGNPFIGSISSYDTHTFQQYSNPNNIAISALAFDNNPFTRSLTAKVMNDRGAGVYVPLHPLNKVIWNLSEPDYVANNVTATKLDGTSYDFASYTDDTLVLKIQTTTFDMVNTFPTLCAFILQASAYDTYNNPTTFITNTAYNFTVDTFPSSALFDSYLKVNYEDSRIITDMWRVTASNYTLTAQDFTTINGTSVISGTRLISFGDGRTTNVETTAINYINPAIVNYDITLLRSGVSATGWFYPHNITSNIKLHFVTRFLSADFIAYPTYVFVGSATQVINTTVDPITSFGVSGYDVGHTEIFVLSAFDSSAVFTYLWKVGDEIVTDNISTVLYSQSTQTPTSGLPIKLEIYSNHFESPMPDNYNDDITGISTPYPNKKTTDNSNILFQHLKLLSYEEPTLSINSYTNNLLLPINNEITATNIVVFPENTPVVENVGISYWTLSTSKWSVNSNSNIFDYTLTLGNDDSVEGVIKYDATYPVILALTRRSYSSIPNTFAPNDYGTQEIITVSSVNITYSAAPEPLFVPVTRYALINQSITFYNETNNSPLISAFYVNNGYTTSSTYITGFNDFITTYPIEGTFNLNITALLVTGDTYTNIIPNAINILSAFQTFDDTVDRIFGATTLSLPNDLQTVKIPSNEWGTAYNFNRSMNLLKDNLTYMQNQTKFYNLPPTDFLGWLGNTSTDITTFKWYTTNVSDYQGMSAAQDNVILSAVNDVVFKNDMMYIADNNEIRILNSNITPTIVNTITHKTIDDTISYAKSIGVDSKDRLYVLDNFKNRVLAFAPYSATSVHSNEFLYEWGKLGGPNAKYGFSNPNDLFVDKTDSIWIADTGNRAIKRYTRSGSWLQTILVDDMVTGITPQTEGIIGITLDSVDNIHILTKSNVFKYSIDGSYIGKYTFKNSKSEQPQKIIGMTTGGFVYICLETSIIKLLENGSTAGEFANDVSGSNYTGIYQDSYNDFYICNGSSILKYFDMNVISSSTETAAAQYYWADDKINVKEDQDISDWVCNLIFKRFYDNIELFKRSLKGKIQYTTDSQGRQIIEIVNFTPTEFNQMTSIPKDEVFVGINELVSAEVLTRCIQQLQTNMERIIPYI